MIEIPILLPDEWLNGYLHRLRYLNSCKDKYILYQLIYQKFPKTTFSIIQSLSILLNLPEREILLQHTLVPAILRSESERSGRDSPRVIPQRMQGCIKFCSHCIKEDIAQWGVPYLHRTHQIVGVDWCLKHQYELQSDFTAEILDLKVLALKSDLKSCRNPLFHQHPITQKYVAIYEGLINYGKQPQIDQVSLVLSTRAKELGLCQKSTKSARFLSDLIIETASCKWLFNHFRMLSDKQPNKFIGLIDRVTQIRGRRPAVPNYVLAAAVMYENADDALNALISSFNIELKPLRARIKRSDAFWKSDEVREIYIKNAGKHKEITEEIGGNYVYNMRSLKSHGLPSLGLLSHKTIQAICDYYNGIPLSHIYKRPGIKQKSIDHIITHARDDFKGIITEICMGLTFKL